MYTFLDISVNAINLDIQGLDLSSSLLPSWEEVALIAKELPALQRLALK
jgi:hypothetical protein